MIDYTRDSISLDRDNRTKVITVCQDIADSLDEWVGIDAIIIDFSKAFDLIHDQQLMKLAASGGGFEGSRLGMGIPCKMYTKGQSRRATIQGSQSNLRCAAGERFGPTTVSSVPK